MLLCSVAGFDASHRVDDLASGMGKPCTPIALGKGLLHLGYFIQFVCSCSGVSL